VRLGDELKRAGFLGFEVRIGLGLPTLKKGD